MGPRENQFLKCFGRRYPGRGAIGVAFAQDMLEVLPIVMDDDLGNVLGIVAMAVVTNDDTPSVHTSQLSVFEQKKGNGTRMLEVLCRKADRLNVVLSFSPIPSPNGEEHQPAVDRLVPPIRFSWLNPPPSLAPADRLIAAIDPGRTLRTSKSLFLSSEE
jgi:hypothetical protein